MHRLGYDRYVAQGGDLGAFVTDEMARRAPRGCSASTSTCSRRRWSARRQPNPPSRNVRHWPDRRHADQRLRLLPRAGHPAADDRLRSAGCTRSPGGLDARPRYRRLLQDLQAFLEKQPSGHLTRDSILDNITLYWLTGTGASAAREYWENGRAAARAAGQAPPPVSVPVGFTVFPGEIFRAPRSWVQKAYPTLAYFHEVDRGGHFAAWEEPELFATEIRAAFSLLR